MTGFGVAIAARKDAQTTKAVRLGFEVFYSKNREDQNDDEDENDSVGWHTKRDGRILFSLLRLALALTLTPENVA